MDRLDGPPAPRRKSMEYGGWPVELFVHTEKSLVDTDGSGARLQQEYLAEVAAGPKPMTADELDLLRYTVTNLLDDLSDASGDVRLAIGSVLWQEAAQLLLTGAGRWSGTGKGLLREVTAYDALHGTDHATALLDGVRSPDDRLIAEVHRILVAYGGPLFAGFELAAQLDG